MDDLWPCKVETFIKDVEMNPVLYDKQHSSYNDETMKENLWKDIGSKNSMNGAQSKIFWTSICTRYVTALKIVTETNYIPQERILYSENLMFMENHLKDFTLDPDDAKLATEITNEIKLELEKEHENNHGIPQHLQMILRQVKLKKWTDTSLMNKYHSEKIPQYRKMVNAMVEIIKQAIRRREALKRKQMERQMA